MPKDTFFNLPKLKRKAIFDAAVREFAVYLFSEASINRIIKMVKISRASRFVYGPPDRMVRDYQEDCA